MGITAFLAMVRKDLLLFLSDRRAVIVAFAVPMVIGSFIGSMTNGAGRGNEPLRIKIALVDLDGSTVSQVDRRRRAKRQESERHHHGRRRGA